MASLSSVKTIWDTLTEVDLTPLREDALRSVRITLLGKEGAGRSRLAYQMRGDPHHPVMRTQTPLLIQDLGEIDSLTGTDLVILVINPASGDMIQEESTAETLVNRGYKLLIIINHPLQEGEIVDPHLWNGWDTKHVLVGDVDDIGFLIKSFVPAMMTLLAADLSPLARAFPLFRVPVANRMINDTCLSNAAYSLSTGLAEIVPVLGIPLTITDMIVLTKMQAFLVYKLGLALGYSTRWQDYAAEFGGVLGGGFLWRQIARSLVGLVPLYGIVPKVAISYAGTYVVGHVVLRWYLTGRHVSADEMKGMFRESFQKGKIAAARLISRKNKAVRPKKKLSLPVLKRRRKSGEPTALPENVEEADVEELSTSQPMEDETDLN